MYSLGYVGQIEYVTPFSSDSDCVQACWNKIDNGGLYEGAVADPSYCYCIITQVGLVVTQGSGRKQIHFLCEYLIVSCKELFGDRLIF